MMANNNREWDRGKDANQAWYNTSAGRAREEDYYGDSKRRKFNGGGYDSTVAYDDHYDAHGRQTTVNAAGFPKKRLLPSEPSPHVIFLGLDPDFTEADLQAYLSSNGCSPETVTIIRERSSGASKGFGFAQFASTEHAKAFVDPLFPFIQVPPPASHGATATTAFYKALEAGQPTNGRRVKIDFSQSATPSERGRSNRGNVNDGTRDIGNSQSAILLFRGLDPLSGPQAIHQAMRNSSGLGKDGAKGMKRIILIKDRVTMASFGFAFVEFVDIQSASTVLASTMSPQIHPAGFRISDRPVAASFGHSDSFQPIDNVMLRDDACIPSSLVLGGVEGTWVRYWDDSSTLAMLEFQVAAPVATIAAKEKEKKKKAREMVKPAAQAIPSAIKISSKPMTLNFNKGPIKINAPTGGIKPLNALGFSGDDGDDDNAEDAFRQAGPSRPSTIIGKKTATNINKWNQVQEELSGGSTALPPALTTTIVEATVSQPAPVKETMDPNAEFEYANIDTKSCLLCSRQFKSVDQLKRHNKESDLHKTNLKDQALQETARQKVQKARQTNTATKYRDRASERRVLFNQPDAPLPETQGAKVFTTKRQTDAPPRLPTPPPAHINPGEDSNNVGNKLLKMMGWTEGTGLGTAGEGRVEPIKTAIFAEGVGLGASKGREVGKYEDGYSGYVSMAQDAARERYDS